MDSARLCSIIEGCIKRKNSLTGNKLVELVNELVAASEINSKRLVGIFNPTQYHFQFMVLFSVKTFSMNWRKTFEECEISFKIFMFSGRWLFSNDRFR
jgi:hypothetical protein